MITLKTLSEASEQEVFDQVARHLLTQMERSENDDHCMYRNPQGLKCAAGCLIADNEYEQEMDLLHGVQWQTLVNKGYAPRKHMFLISRLQTIHDNYGACYWSERLRAFAKDRGFNTDVLDEFGNEYE